MQYRFNSYAGIHEFRQNFERFFTDRMKIDFVEMS